MQRLEGRTVLVTGAGSGIGKASALRIASEGASVFCVDLNGDAVEATAAQIRSAAGEATACTGNLADESSVNETVKACIDRYGSLHGVVNMAGVLRFDDTEQLQANHWQKVIDVNLTGTMYLCRAALPHLVQTQGSIVNAASTAALQGLPCGVAYSASKGGVLAMTRSIAVEYAKRGVRANCVCPGDINTNMTDGIGFPETMDFDLMPRIMSLTGAKSPEVVAGVIAMLISDDGIHITGEDIRVDGGTLS
ncbi:SDR family NAD(P)-dependent oxidoreductase [Candidatus Marimicrobium litorale]|uniref:SDR family oxidoreductase n=1 Tax=Candidatus Marimicrobium litorale TaxID=2518991 RepID=A0ABT3T0P0_9GAMM|nr:SDR family NAD(P)-dependent oxidoreductase [Candidatus Marimicrobium litorale]MCX2975821.1 SDR family oxidoreductase [Candidatus Marimicrobium litorale]